MAEQEKSKLRTSARTKKTSVTTEETGRLQPQARELEEAVLGALMIEKDAYSLVSETLRPESFYDKTHELIFSAIRKLAIQQHPIDMLTVVDQLRKDGELEAAGGISHIAELSQKVVSSAHIEYHARIIAQKFLARELITFSSEIASQAFDESNDVDDLMEEADSKLFEISKRNLKKDVIHISPVIHEALDLMHEAAKRTDGLSGLKSGFNALDKITSGWQNSDLIIIAARPGMGKTAFVLSMTKNMAVNFNIPVAVFSLEMSNVQLVNRLIVNVAELAGDKIKTGNLAEYEWIQLDSKINSLYEAPIYIDDTPGLSILELRTKARRLVKEHKVKCIIVDYLQLMNVGEKAYGTNREGEVRVISGSLKNLAKELNIPVIALSQLNRSIDIRTNQPRTSKESFDSKRPQLSDLRESGAIEQDADIVCFIHRPEYYKIFDDGNGHDLTGIAEIIIAKHRNGSTGEIRLEFKKEFARFQNLDEAKIMSDIQSRVSSQANVIPEERRGNWKKAPQLQPDDGMPF